MDRLLRRLRRRYAEERSSASALAWAEALLRAEGGVRVTWEEVEELGEQAIARLALRLRPVVRRAVMGYLSNTEFSGARFRAVPLEDLSRLTRAHWLALPGVGPVTLAQVDEVLGSHGFDLDEGDPRLATADLLDGQIYGEEQLLSLRRRLQQTEVLLAEYQRRCRQLESAVRGNLYRLELAEARSSGDGLEPGED